MVSGDGVRPLPSKIEAVLQIPVPETITHLRSFLGMCNFFRAHPRKRKMERKSVRVFTAAVTDTAGGEAQGLLKGNSAGDPRVGQTKSHRYLLDVNPISNGSSSKILSDLKKCAFACSAVTAKDGDGSLLIYRPRERGSGCQDEGKQRSTAPAPVPPPGSPPILSLLSPCWSRERGSRERGGHWPRG